MTGASPTLTLRKRRLTAYRGRGAIYNWLRAHHPTVAARLTRGEATWPALCAEMVRHGVAGRQGEPPTPKAAAKVWRRVCRDLDAEPAAPRHTPDQTPSRPGVVYPSRIPADWRPQELAPAAQPQSGEGKAVAPFDPQAHIARMRRVLNSRSGRT